MAQDLFDGKTLKKALQNAERYLGKHIEELNLLNVFPVPDGDTGINMFLTMQAANKAVSSIETNSAAAVSAAASRGAIMGASGNSGVILSQILRGIAKGLEMKTRFTCIHFAQALSTASDMARRAVTNPVEGTIITVSREASEMAIRMAERGASMEQIMSAIVTQAKKTVQKTPELLPPLKEAGVVDAGGKGLFYVFQGMNAYINKHVSRARESRVSAPTPLSETPIEGYGFDVQFLIHGEKLSLAEIRAKIETMGESVIVVGDEQLIRVHIHTPTPDNVLDYARSVGKITDVVTQNMDEQVKEFREKHNLMG